MLAVPRFSSLIYTALVLALVVGCDTAGLLTGPESEDGPSPAESSGTLELQFTREGAGKTAASVPPEANTLVLRIWLTSDPTTSVETAALSEGDQVTLRLAPSEDYRIATLFAKDRQLLAGGTQAFEIEAGENTSLTVEIDEWNLAELDELQGKIEGGSSQDIHGRLVGGPVSEPALGTSPPITMLREGTAEATTEVEVAQGQFTFQDYTFPAPDAETSYTYRFEHGIDGSLYGLEENLLLTEPNPILDESALSVTVTPAGSVTIGLPDR